MRILESPTWLAGNPRRSRRWGVRTHGYARRYWKAIIPALALHLRTALLKWLIGGPQVPVLVCERARGPVARFLPNYQ